MRMRLVITVLAATALAVVGCGDSSSGGDDGSGAGGNGTGSGDGSGGAGDGSGGAGGGGGGGGGGFGVGSQPKLEVGSSGLTLSDNDSILVNLGTSQPGDVISVGRIDITNQGDGELLINEVSVSPGDVYDLVPQDDVPLAGVSGSISVWPLTSEDGLRFYSIDILAVVPDDGVLPAGTITIRSNDEFYDAELVRINLDVEGADPEIGVTPGTVEFGNVSQGEAKNKPITILNTGTGDLKVTGFVMTGAPSFAVQFGADEYINGEIPEEGITFDEPLIIPPGTSTNSTIKFAPTDASPAEATLILYSNDPDAKSGKVVPISGNLSGPCISINPKKVDFGGKLIGKEARVDVEILSCGESPLSIKSIQIVEFDTGVPSSSDFGIDLAEFTGAEPGAEVPILTEADAPVELAVNEKRTFQVKFTPDEINALDEFGQPIPDLGKIRIVSDAFASTLDVEIRGFGVEVECPTSVIIIQEGEEVIPQTKLHLVGSQSYAAAGAISKYEWSVQQPAGSQSVFLPSAAAPDPTFVVNVAGTYIFKLRVWDANGEQSCIDAEATVFVNPDEAIHVELLWHTPNDPDETDEGPEAGADLDLHFLHPFATGEDVDGDGTPDGWFDQPFDCFWFNAHPNWASLDPMVDDDPGLDLDDTDGAGPENVNLNIPEDGQTYKVGVHYWNDHGFGPSLATVRIYIYSSLVFQLDDVEMVHQDMWEVATIAWPSGEVTLKTDSGGNYKIIPNYQHPFFPTPE